MQDDVIVINFPSRVDTPYCQDNASDIATKVGAAAKVEFNMQGVVFVCSSFLRICLQAAKEKGRDSFSVTQCGPETMKVFKISGYDSVMKIS